MKKLAAALSALMVLTTSASTMAFAANENFDINGDGAVNNLDIGFLRKYDLTKNGETDIPEELKDIELTDEINSTIEEFYKAEGVSGWFDAMELFFKEGLFVTDANKDGKFDEKDPQYVLDYYGDLQTGRGDKYTDEEKAYIKDNFDYDYDGAVNSLDVVTLLNHFKELDPETYDKLFNKPSSHKKGDVNYDGAVDALDASEVLSLYAKVQTGGDIEWDFSSIDVVTYGDVNEDGEINALDASLILAEYAAAQTK